MRFSVVVTAFDQLSRDALRRQTYPDFEVLSRGEAAEGDIVAFLGDAIPDPLWLEQLAAAFADPAVAAAGGVVFDPSGYWLRHRFAVRDRQDRATREIEPPLTPYLLPGADPFAVLHESNSAFRREYLAGVVDVGELCRRLIDGGRRVVCLGGAAVYLRAAVGPPVATGELRAYSPEKRLSVCIIARGGPPDLARDLAAEGHEIHVVAETDNEPAIRPGEDGVWAHRVPVRTTGGWDRPELRPIVREALGWAAAAHAEVRRIAAARTVDLVVAPVAGAEGLFCLLDDELQTVLTLGTTLRAAADERPARRLDPALPELFDLEQFVLKHARHLTAASRAAFGRVERDYGFPVAGAVIPPGITEPAESPWKSGTAIRVLAIGRPAKSSGTDLFLAAAAELGPEFPDAEFAIAADTSDISACDIFCLPARHEPGEPTAIEAMACGKPVVASAVGALAEIVVDGVTGHLAYPGSADSLAANLRPLLASRELRERYGAAARRRFEANFRRELIVQEAVRAYTAMAESFAA
jgi:glycosyltransferase involved in cell wall biosynthesis